MEQGTAWRVTDMAYVSLGTPNIESSIAHFKNTFGMEEVSDFSAHRLYGWLRMVMGNGSECYQEMLQPTNDTLPLGRFVEKNGAGIYVASYVVDDLAACYRDLMAKGVRFSTGPGVSRGERAHAIWIHPRATTGVYIELTDHLLWRNVHSRAVAPTSVQNEVLIRNVSHIAALVRDLPAAIELYRGVMNFEVIEGAFGDAEQGGARTMMGQGGRGYIELIQPDKNDARAQEWLDTKGEGPYFAAFVCDNVSLSIETIKSRGGNVSLSSDGKTGWVHPETGHGEMMYLTERYAVAE